MTAVLHDIDSGLMAPLTPSAPDFGARDDLPCRMSDADIWFAESPARLEEAKSLCAQCPVMAECLLSAIERREPWGVWGGQIFEHGEVIARKRGRGRPRKHSRDPHEMRR